MPANVWKENVGEEVSFWERWLVDDTFKQQRDARLQPGRPFPKEFLDLIGLPEGQQVRVLDIGSGPISTLGAQVSGQSVELICADALADSYNALLNRLGFGHLPRIQSVKGEDLVETYGLRAFDIVHCANALDHFEDPALSFRNMFEVCRPSGAVILISVENEGERERYHGLHQWNLRTDDEGVWLWNRDSNVNLLDGLSPIRDFRWRYVHEDPKFKVFQAVIRSE